MKYNIEKINEIGKLWQKLWKRRWQGGKWEDIRIVDLEMEVRESLRAVGQSAVKYYLEKTDREVEAKIECKCGGKLVYQWRQTATIGSVLGK